MRLRSECIVIAAMHHSSSGIVFKLLVPTWEKKLVHLEYHFNVYASCKLWIIFPLYRGANYP